MMSEQSLFTLHFHKLVKDMTISVSLEKDLKIGERARWRLSAMVQCLDLNLDLNYNRVIVIFLESLGTQDCKISRRYRSLGFDENNITRKTYLYSLPR